MRKRDVCAAFRVMFVCCYRRDSSRRLPPEMLVRVSPVPPVRPVLGPLRVDVFFSHLFVLTIKKNVCSCGKKLRSVLEARISKLI